MPLVHDFLLIKQDQIKKNDLFSLRDFKKQGNKEMIVQIQDDLILYMMDSFKWIRTTNPFNDETIYGLFYHGISLIDFEGAITLNSITQAWYNLFLSAPDIVKLTGGYYTIEGEPEIPGQYEIITFNKKDILSRLNKLNELSNRAKNSEDKFQIIHYGI
ncbi:hypothetical protein ACFPYJ_00060 [Paenibacillus solisilvae]|uniref:Uncharacterized protein n=1 Tax=Paenibacillus solisilvae TaxID=2486751 RepID=A0ABW0VTL5_9BACL